MKQQLSALIDGEADIDRCEHVFLAAKSSGEVAQAWQSYHVIRDVMRNEFHGHLDMTSRVMAALEDEPTVLAPVAKLSSNKKDNSSYNPLTWSVAASVAAALFVGLFVFDQASTPAQLQIAETDATQYVMAHHNYAPSSATYYVHNVAFNGE